MRAAKKSVEKSVEMDRQPGWVKCHQRCDGDRPR